MAQMVVYVSKGSEAGHPNLTSASRPTRERKITTKQASQNRRNIEKQQKKNAKLAKKPKTVDTS
jgi:hypothetical protein